MKGKIKYEYLSLMHPNEVDEWLFENASKLDYETKRAVFSLMHFVHMVGAFFNDHEDELDKFVAYTQGETGEKSTLH
jgi:hypothetical protein